MMIFHNHLGFLPASAKVAVLGGGHESEFAICRTADGQAVYHGRFERAVGDFGIYSQAEFSGS